LDTLSNILSSNGLDLEVQCYQREHQCLKILNEVVEDTQTFRVLRLCDIDEGANLSRLDSKSVSCAKGPRSY
jgi:hypothetical protein